MQRQDGVLRLGALGSFLVAAAIVVASVLFALSQASATEETTEALSDIQRGRGFWLLAHIAFLAISLFLAPVVPALYVAHRAAHPAAARLGFVAWVGAIPATVLPVALAIALVPLSDRFVGAGTGRAVVLPAAEAVRMALLVGFGAMGILIGGGTALFGLAMVRGAWPSWLGWLGVIGGVMFAVGAALPPLILLFVLANVLGTIWFFAVGLRLYRERG
ncbi:MAG TPA: DUF4386 family protein [Actinomycetota bacterium]|nr:DUF4386 family protein [Actinomycetota bacterium]